LIYNKSMTSPEKEFLPQEQEQEQENDNSSHIETDDECQYCGAPYESDRSCRYCQGNPTKKAYLSGLKK
jgi:hypothetical protein